MDASGKPLPVSVTSTNSYQLPESFKICNIFFFTDVDVDASAALAKL
jgi:hypothetical protein